MLMNHKSRELTINHRISTKTYEKRTLFMQNEPNFKNAEMNVSSALSRRYGDFHILGRRKNEPNTNPIRSQTNPIKANFKAKRTQSKPISSPAFASKTSNNKSLSTSKRSGYPDLSGNHDLRTTLHYRRFTNQKALFAAFYYVFALFCGTIFEENLKKKRNKSHICGLYR